MSANKDYGGINRLVKTLIEQTSMGRLKWEMDRSHSLLGPDRYSFSISTPRSTIVVYEPSSLHLGSNGSRIVIRDSNGEVMEDYKSGEMFTTRELDDNLGKLLKLLQSKRVEANNFIDQVISDFLNP